MINIKNGNILNCTEDIIVHQVNVQGIMGGGLARQLADRYPNLEKEYKKYCDYFENSFKRLWGDVCWSVKENKVIANTFSQDENFNTNYKAIEKCLLEVREFAQRAKWSIAIPYGIGCGIANGEWNEVYKIIKEVFENSNIQCTLYKL